MLLLKSLRTKIQNKKNENIYKRELSKLSSDSCAVTDTPSSEMPKLFSEYVEQGNLPEAMAIADEALKRTKGMTFFDTQKVSALLLSRGELIEMATGEGKTLAFALAAAIKSKSQRVTVSTANDFLSHRDWLSCKPFFDILGITSSSIVGTSTRDERHDAYSSNIVYATVRELAYDYLRDGVAPTKEMLFSSATGFLLIDEIDNVLIDNAASPYVLSDEIEIDGRLVVAAHDFALQSKADSTNDENFLLADEDEIELTENGMNNLESFLVKFDFISDNEDLYSLENMRKVHLFESAARAIHVLSEGVDYVIENNRIIPIDKSSGRKLNSVTLSNGLQQILEYKHNLDISKETFAIATIVTESVVTLFDDYAGMSGTLKVEEDELTSVYGKSCITIPRKDPLLRVDNGDVMFLSKTEKTRYTLERVVSSYQKGQPVMVAASSETEAEGLSRALSEMKMPHQLITSKKPAEEASMIAMAGVPHKVTVTTGACGRGTDIVLGGNLDHFIDNGLIEDEKIEDAKVGQIEAKKKAIDAGGLLVIGFGRQSTQKVDLQLRGRSGRQGDVGESVFVLSLDDNILGEYGVKLRNMLRHMNIDEKDMLSHSSITKAFDNAQRGVRENILKARKFHGQQASILEKQREIIYNLRISLLTKEDWKEHIRNELGLLCDKELTAEDAIKIFDEEREHYMDIINDLRKSIGLQSYANKDPVQELKRKSYSEYNAFLMRLNKRFENKILAV